MLVLQISWGTVDNVVIDQKSSLAALHPWAISRVKRILGFAREGNYMSRLQGVILQTSEVAGNPSKSQIKLFAAGLNLTRSCLLSSPRKEPVCVRSLGVSTHSWIPLPSTVSIYKITYKKIYILCLQ